MKKEAFTWTVLPFDKKHQISPHTNGRVRQLQKETKKHKLSNWKVGTDSKKHQNLALETGRL